MSKGLHRSTADIVAIILAGGIALALNVLTVALLYAALIRLGIDSDKGLSENGTQILTGWGGGIIGVLGAYVGYAFGKRVKSEEDDKFPPEESDGDSSTDDSAN